MKKTKIIIIVIATVLVIGLVAGGIYLGTKNKNKLTDEEAKEILSVLIPKSQEINEIIWGKGLPVEAGSEPAFDSVSAAQYRTVDGSCGYKNTDDLKTAIGEVYSERYIETGINYTAFEGSKKEGTEEYDIYPRYKDNNDGRLCIDITNDGFCLNTEISAENAKVTKADFDRVDVDVEATAEGVKIPLTLTLVKEQNGWRLDTPTY